MHLRIRIRPFVDLLRWYNTIVGTNVCFNRGDCLLSTTSFTQVFPDVLSIF